MASFDKCNRMGSTAVGRTVVKNARLMTMTGEGLGIIEKGALAAEDGVLTYAGEESGLPDAALGDARVIDGQGFYLSPGLIDCHTHLVFGGNRAKEFEMRLEGASYEEIARSGGGINSTVENTRGLPVDALVAASLPRLDALLGEGVTTVEIKSGYGLDIESECKMLRAARHLGALRPVRVRTTCLAAHALPPDYKGRGDAYIADVVLPAIETAHRQGLVDAVDGFCENIAFSREQITQVFDKARALGIPVKLHTEQLSNQHGAELAASYGALSADHLEYLDDNGVAALARSGTVAVILPGAFYTIHETQKPPVKALRDAGVKIALATDCNPGTSPLTSLLLTMNMAATLFDLPVTDCLRAVTVQAAHALGLQDEIGTLEVGKAADIAIWEIEEPSELVYRIGFNPLHMVLSSRKVQQAAG